MSIIKLAFAITLSVVPVILSFVEPAAAQRRLRTNTYSQTGSDQQNALAQFNLANTDRDGSEITDSASDLRIGLFQGAIQDYISGNGEVCINGGNLDFQPNCPASSNNIGRYVLDASGFVIFNPDRPFVPNTGIIFDADLRAEFIENDPAFEFFGGIRNSIAYSIVRPGQIESILNYRLDFARFGIDPNQAVNNLSYILEQNVLGKASSAVTFTDGSIQLVGGDVLIQNRFERDIPNAVPEPSTALGALAAVSIGVLFKRKNKQV
ncbi:PEP-CTERM sorting domain-containing protein [Nostoc sp. CHAB 5844]|nr:PEP-CTERM sorting domain-containing protein [Nostoc sp. CHAB 5844]